MKSRSVFLLMPLLFSGGALAQTVAEKPGEAVEVSAKEIQSAIRDQKMKKSPPDFVQFDQPPEVIKQVHPKYPSEGLKDNAEGTVYTKIWVDEKGKVVDVKVEKSDNAVFNQAAMDAAKQWAFKPALVKEKPVAVWIMVPFRFKLSEGKGKAPSPGTPVDAQSKTGSAMDSQNRPPEVVKQVAVKYPEEAKKKGLEGAVWLKIEIDEAGKPTSASVMKSDSKVFEQAAVDAALQWIFKPAMKDGKPVSTIVTVPFNFKLADSKKK